MEITNKNTQTIKFFFENAPVAFQSLNANGELVLVNRYWLESMGYTKEEVIGKNFTEFLSPASANFFQNNFDKITQQVDFDGFEIELVTKSGEIKEVIYSGQCEFDDKGQFIKTNCFFKDVTSIRRVEKAFRDSEERAGVLIETHRDVAFLVDREWKIVDYNHKAEEFLGGQLGNDLKGKDVFELLPEETRENRLRVFNAVCRNRQSMGFSEKSRDAFYQNWVNPIIDRNGEVKYLAVFSYDVTKRELEKKQQQQLNQLTSGLLQPGTLREKMEQLAKGIHDIFSLKMVRIWALKGCDFEEDECPFKPKASGKKTCDRVNCFHLLSCAGLCENYLGLEERIPVHSGIINKVLREENSCFIARNQEITALGVPQSVVEENNIESALGFRLVATDGNLLGVMVLFAGHDFEEVEVERLANLANIAGFVLQAEMKNEEMMELLIRQSETVKAGNIGLWEWDLKSGRVYFSPIWKKQIGYEDHEIRNEFEEWEKRVHPDDLPAVKEKLDECLSGNSSQYNVEFRFRHKDGTYRHIVARASVLFDDDGQAVRLLGTHLDLTKMKQTEAQLRAANATKDKFMSIISHDLRGPIGSMVELSRLVVTEGVNLSIASRQRIDETMYRSLQSIYRLLDNLLTWSRAQRGLIEMNFMDFDLRALIYEIKPLFEQQAQNKLIEIVDCVADEMKVKADWDTAGIVLRNLLSNAIKFTPRRGKIEISAEEIAFEGKRFCKVCVADNGLGIPEDKLKILFDLNLSKRSTTGTEKETGTGLGLILCQEFVQKNGGEIWVESELNEGSRFYFTLPMA